MRSAAWRSPGSIAATRSRSSPSRAATPSCAPPLARPAGCTGRRSGDRRSADGRGSRVGRLEPGDDDRHRGRSSTDVARDAWAQRSTESRPSVGDPRSGSAALGQEPSTRTIEATRPRAVMAAAVAGAAASASSSTQKTYSQARSRLGRDSSLPMLRPAAARISRQRTSEPGSLVTARTRVVR